MHKSLVVQLSFSPQLNLDNDERTTHSIPIGSMTYAEYVCIIFGVAVSDWTG